MFGDLPMKRKRAFGVPETRGPLRVYVLCPTCKGDKPLGCCVCWGDGEILIETVPATTARRQAAHTVRRTQGPGTIGRDM